MPSAVVGRGRLSDRTRRWVLRLLQLAVLAFVFWRAGRELSGQWGAVRARGGVPRPDWPLVAGSALLVLATYALLVQAWRLLVRASDQPGAGRALGFWPAARIWSVANLGRYVPGKVWSIVMMGSMARQTGVSAVAATGSAVLGTLINIAAGFAVVLLAGSRVVSVLAPGATRSGLVVAGVVTLGLLALPLLLPGAARLAVRLLKRELAAPSVAPGQLYGVVLGNVAAWIGYGIAFGLLATACLPHARLVGHWLEYTAVFTGSYLAGYLALIVPGGLGVRELAMVSGLTGLGLLGAVDAWWLAVASRLWLTVLEVVPGVVFILRDLGARRRPDPPSPSSDATPNRSA